MIIIIINNSQSRLVNISPRILSLIKMNVCYFNMSIWIRTRNKYKATTFLIDNDGFFPTGLLKKICALLNKHGEPYILADNRIKPKIRSLNLKNKISEPPMYEEQQIAVDTMFNSECGICEMPTGIGKSRTIKEFLLKSQRPTLVITPSSNLRAQTYEYLSASFGTDDIGLLKVSHDKPVIVTNYHAIKSKPPEYFNQFSQLIFDEFHNAAATSIRKDFNDKLFNVYYRFGLTATAFKNDSSENIYLESILSDSLYTVSVKHAISRGYIKPLVPFFFNLKNDLVTSSDDYRADLKPFIDNNQERNGLAIETAQKMIANNIPTLILVDHVEHGHLIKASLGKDALFLNGQDESANYNMKMVKEFNELKIPCLIGTSVLGEGVDTKACGAIINLSGGKARSELMQKCGRAIRNFPNKNVGYYFDFIDNKQKNLLQHSEERFLTIEEVYGIKPTLLE